jgi:molybdate transport system substrate-binding protein
MIQRVKHTLSIGILSALFLAMVSPAIAQQGVTVCAAASLARVLDEIVASAQIPYLVRTSYSGSATLAKQIDAGAPCDIFVSANTAWVDYLEGLGLIAHNTRAVVATNRLVVIRPSKNHQPKTLEYLLTSPSDDRLAIAEPSSVPAGIYAKEALAAEGLWESANQKTLMVGPSVTTVLKWVESDEADLGIVYASDFARSDRISLVHIFPVTSHSPITYELAIIAERNTAEAREISALFRSPLAKQTLQHAGFFLP